ncbi:MAG: hypothetical protein AB2L21_06065 [Anaerolineaceae bacterium]
MKRIFRFSMLLILFLSACSSSSTDAECKEGICISIEVEGPVQALEPARFIISVKTEKDISELPIGLSVFPGVTISDIENIPENASLVYQDETMLDWQINTKGGQEYSFSGYIILSEPTVSYGIFSYSVLAFFTQPTFGRVSDSVTIYLDAEGKQIEESRVKLELETDFPAPTPPPDLTIIPETPFPTIVWPTVTPLPSPSPSPTITRTPTLPVYP